MSPVEHNTQSYRLRAKLPLIARSIALVVLVAVILGIITAYVKSRTKPQFSLRPEEARLSKEVTAEVSNYERTETKDGAPVYSVKAAVARTFSDQHQELENVEFTFFDSSGKPTDRLTADLAIYIPKADKDFTAILRENVLIRARDGVEIRTNSVVYERNANTAEADGSVTFSRANLTGKSDKALLNMTTEALNLTGNVEFDLAQVDRGRTVSIRSGYAVFDRLNAEAIFSDTVRIRSVSADNSSLELAAPRLTAYLDRIAEEKISLKKIKAAEGVNITSRSANAEVTDISSNEAVFDVYEDKFDLSGNVRIESGPASSRAKIAAATAVYQRSSGNFSLANASVQRPGEQLSGERIDGRLHSDNSLKDVIIRGSALSRKEDSARTIEVRGQEINASFLKGGSVSNATAAGNVAVVVTPSTEPSYSRATLTAERGVGVNFRSNGEVEKARADGRAKLVLEPASSAPNPVLRSISAETLRTTFRSNGRDLAFAEAVGSAVLDVDPINGGENVFRTVVRAPRLECDFFDKGNNVRTCTASPRANASRFPKSPSPRRGEQRLSADRFIAYFPESGGQIERIDAIGSAKFSELDRNASSREISFTQSDRVVRLRGGDPTVWDSRARARAGEIDWDTAADRSFLRNRVSTTFYNNRTFGAAAPFSSASDPVFVTAEKAEFDHSNENALFTGNARAWQQLNYVRADVLFIDQKNGLLKGDGNVQSRLTRVRNFSTPNDSTVPVHASASAILYERSGRVIKYRGNVDIRQGSDRLTAENVDIYLAENNDVSRTVAETSVVITQPGRRGAGDWAQYDANSGSVILRGDPASVSDAQTGATQSAQITYFLKDKKATSIGRSDRESGGRTRTVYRVRPPQ
jgi:lipopolysaccharide export system protein LptA